MEAISIDQALRLLGLNAATIDAEKLMAAYRAAAKKFHPDSCKNNKAKAASAECLTAAIEARNLLREKLQSGELPRKEAARPGGRMRGARKERSTERGEGQKEKKRGEERTWCANPFIHDERGFYDDIHKPPFQLMLHHKWIGPIFVWPFGLGLIAAMLACATVFAALALPGAVIALIVLLVLGEDRAASLKTKGSALLDYAWGLPIFPIYYLASAAGAYVWTERYGHDIYLAALSLCWFGISCVVFDEIYSLLRYHLFLRKRLSRALAALQEY